jgi:hypothetical protein
MILHQPGLAVGAHLLPGFRYSFLVQETILAPTVALLTNAAAITVMAALIPVGGILRDRCGRKDILRMGAVWAKSFIAFATKSIALPIVFTLRKLGYIANWISRTRCSPSYGSGTSKSPAFAMMSGSRATPKPVRVAAR